MSKITPVHYVVTNTFGKAEEGDVRLAFLVGGPLTNEPGLLYHPRGRGECASVEICQRHPTDHFLGKPLFHSLDGVSYVNLTPTQARAYEGMITAAGLEVPRNPVVAHAVQQFTTPPEPPRRKRAPR